MESIIEQKPRFTITALTLTNILSISFIAIFKVKPDRSQNYTKSVCFQDWEQIGSQGRVVATLPSNRVLSINQKEAKSFAKYSLFYGATEHEGDVFHHRLHYQMDHDNYLN